KAGHRKRRRRQPGARRGRGVRAPGAAARSLRDSRGRPPAAGRSRPRRDARPGRPRARRARLLLRDPPRPDRGALLEAAGEPPLSSPCHSEERSDEESAPGRKLDESRSFATLRMTEALIIAETATIERISGPRRPALK